MQTLNSLDWRLLLCLVGLGLLGTWVPLFDLDEGAFLEATRELIDGGHWAATTLDGEPRYDKPILSYWFQALSLVSLKWLSPFIPIEVIGRLPSVIAGALWAFVLGRFAAKQTGKSVLGIFVSFALITTLGTLIISRAATADALLNLLLALLFIDIASFIRAPSDKLRLRVFIWFAFGIMTKGPIAFLIPASAFVIWIVISRQWPLFREAVSSIKAWSVFAALLVPWLIGVSDAQGFAFFENFFLRHNIERFSSNLHGHGGHPLYYLLVTPFVLLPYSALLFYVVFRAPSLWQCKISQFGLIWIGIVTLLVSLSSTQLPHYVIYATPPVFFFYARILPDLKSRLWALPGIVLPIGLICLGLFHSYIQTPANPRDAEQMILLVRILEQWWWPLCLTIAALTILSVAILIAPCLMLAQRLLAMGGIQLATITLIILPLLSEARQAPIKQAALMAKKENADVVTQGVRMPSFSFYRESITREKTPKPGQWVLISVNRLSELIKQKIPFHIKAAGAGWRLIAIKNPEII